MWHTQCVTHTRDCSLRSNNFQNDQSSRDLECRNIINCSLVHICESFGGTRSKMVARTDLTEVVSTRIVCWTLESTFGRVRRNSVYLTRIFHRNQLFQWTLFICHTAVSFIWTPTVFWVVTDIEFTSVKNIQCGGREGGFCIRLTTPSHLSYLIL